MFSEFLQSGLSFSGLALDFMVEGLQSEKGKRTVKRELKDQKP